MTDIITLVVVCWIVVPMSLLFAIRVLFQPGQILKMIPYLFDLVRRISGCDRGGEPQVTLKEYLTVVVISLYFMPSVILLNLVMGKPEKRCFGFGTGPMCKRCPHKEKQDA